jgi:hypothetical protein
VTVSASISLSVCQESQTGARDGENREEEEGRRKRW